MEKNLPLHLQEIIFSSSDKAVSKQISKLEKAGKIKKIAARIYTPNFIDSPETVIRRNLFTILGKLYPDAVLSHRSALEFQPTPVGHIFLTYSYTKKIQLPGITLRFMQGHGPIEGDNPLSGELYASQLERALLENLQPSRQSGHESKTCPLTEVENRLEQVVRTRGENGLNELRDRAREIALQLGMEVEFEKLNKLVGALLATRQHDPAPYLRMLQRAHEFSATIVGDDMDAMKNHLEKSNAFKEHDQAQLRILPV